MKTMKEQAIMARPDREVSKTLMSKKKNKKKVQNKFEKASGISKGKDRMNKRQDKMATLMAKFVGNENLYLTETGKKFARKINKD